MIKRERDIEKLHTIISTVHQSFDLHHIYNTALDLVLTLNNVDMAFIYMISKDRKEAVLKACRNLTEDYMSRARRVPYPKGVTWKVLNSGQVLNITDIQKDEDIGAAGKDLGHHRALGIPIIIEGVVMGVIWLASYKTGKFSDEEIKLNVSIGNDIGIAIAKAKLFEEKEELIRIRTAELEDANKRLKQAENEIRVVREQHEVVNAIKRILKKEKYLYDLTADKLVADAETEIANNKPLHEMLSDREYKIMIMIASGMSNKNISKQTFLSRSTVSTYRKRILDKLNLETTPQLIRYVLKNNLED